MKGPVVGTCYVCHEDVRAVPVEMRMMARREMNVPTGSGPNLRHSYCAPGSDRWAAHLGTSKRDRFWAHIFGFIHVDGTWVRKEAQ